jgi:hypothetical protein
MRASAEKGHDRLAAPSFAGWNILLAGHLPRMAFHSSGVAATLDLRQMRMRGVARVLVSPQTLRSASSATNDGKSARLRTPTHRLALP